jgi:hypothetical protein
MTVVVLEDAAADLEAGRGFYERRERGVGESFVESLPYACRQFKTPALCRSGSAFGRDCCSVARVSSEK